MTARAASLERPGQIAWGAIGGLTPYVVAGLNAVGYRVDFPLPSFGWGSVLALLLSPPLCFFITRHSLDVGVNTVRAQ